MAEGDFGGGPFQDLVTPDGIYLGLGDGTFQSMAVGGPLAAPGETVQAIAVGAFQKGGPDEIAVAETNADGGADFRVLSYNGGGYTVVDSFALAAAPYAMIATDLGDGTLGLAIAEQGETTESVALYSNDGAAASRRCRR